MIWILQKELWLTAAGLQLLVFFFLLLLLLPPAILYCHHGSKLSPKKLLQPGWTCLSLLILGGQKKLLTPFGAASWRERPYVWLACCYMMKTMMRKLKPPSSREDLQSGILDFITAALPSLAAPLVCRFSLASSAWTLSGSVRQKNVCTTQKRPPAPPAAS